MTVQEFQLSCFTGAQRQTAAPYVQCKKCMHCSGITHARTPPLTAASPSETWLAGQETARLPCNDIRDIPVPQRSARTAIEHVLLPLCVIINVGGRERRKKRASPLHCLPRERYRGTRRIKLPRGVAFIPCAAQERSDEYMEFSLFVVMLSRRIGKGGEGWVEGQADT